MMIFWPACPNVRAAVTVNFAGGFLADNAISAWNGSFSNTTMNSRPDLLPFNGPGIGATRYTGNNPVNLLGSGNILATVYTRINGNGSISATASGGTTSAYGSSFTNYSLQTFASGTRLPTAGATGTLGSALSLPNGTVLGAGTVIYADFLSYVMDYNKAAAYWYDSTTHRTHQVYENGVMDFYYLDGGSYQRFASYQNSTLEFALDYTNGSGTRQWTGTSTAVNNVILPATMDASGFLGGLNVSGVSPGELGTAPYVGFFATYNTNFAMTFDDLNAYMAPEPSRVVFFAGGMLAIVLRHSRRWCLSS